MTSTVPDPPSLSPSQGAFSGRTHKLPVRVYYEDTDFTGVVYHANYLRYFERGRSDFVRAIGVSHTDLLQESRPTAFSVVTITLHFRRPARIDDALIVETSFDTIKGPRLLIGQCIKRGAEVIAEAQVVVCCIDLEGRAVRPPASLLQRLRSYLLPDPEQQ